MNTHGIVKLNHLGIIRAAGPDAASFLHGQLSNDMAHLDAQHARLAAYCSAQGRMLASFIVIKSTPEELLLICAADLLEATLKRLSMFVLRAKVKLTNASSELSLYGLACSPERMPDFLVPAAVPWACQHHDAHLAVRLPDAAGTQRYLIVASSQQTLPAFAALPESTWDWLEIQSGIPMVRQQIREQYVPQMLNYESIGGIDFAKGCYPGQEVISRSQFRGTLKRHTYLLSSNQALQPGEEVLTATEPAQPAGAIIAAAPGPDHGWSALAVLRTDDAQPPLKTASGADVNIEPLPYPLRTDF